MFHDMNLIFRVKCHSGVIFWPAVTSDHTSTHGTETTPLPPPALYTSVIRLHRPHISTDVRICWPRWLVIYRDRCPYPSTNRARWGV